MVRRPLRKTPKLRTAPTWRMRPSALLPLTQAFDRAHAMIRDPAGAISFWASGLERLYGFTSAEAVGRISHDLLNTEFPCSLKDIDTELHDTGEWNGELLQRTRDGGTIAVASHWALWRKSGSAALVAEINNKISDRDHAYLASIVNSSGDAIVGKTLRGIVTSWNKAAERMFGYTAEDILGKSITTLIPPDRISEEDFILQQLAQGERIDHFETLRRRKDGSDLVVSLTISPILDRSGQVVGASKIARDITEHKAFQNRLVTMQSELLHASRLSMMGQMVAAITHELNQPLSAVNTYLSGIAKLLASTDSPSSVTEALGKAREQSARAGEIVRRLRDLAVKGETNCRVEHINDILEQTLGLALIDTKVLGIKTTILLGATLDPVLVDKIQIGQVILNLVRNAIEAMESVTQRNLTITTETDHDMGGVRVTIADTGPGISPDVKERLFQPFVTTKAKGMGIGLSLCRDIVANHGGTLSAESNEPTGTIFTIRLPAAVDSSSDKLEAAP